MKNFPEWYAICFCLLIIDMLWRLTSMLHFRAVTNQFTLVFNPVCQCGTHEGFTQDLGSVLLWRINYYLPNDNGHAKNEGKGQHTIHQVIFLVCLMNYLPSPRWATLKFLPRTSILVFKSTTLIDLISLGSH